MPALVILIVAAYLLGSIPFGMIIASLHGKDLRKIGSGNIGATNVARAMGKRWAYICFLLDVCKGLLPMLIAKSLIENVTITSLSLWLAVGCAAVLGHIFPVYLKFKGGKGVATSLGIVLGLYPYFTVAGIIAFLVWIIFVLIWKYVSLASMAAAVVFPIALLTAILINDNWHLQTLWPLVVVSFLMTILVTARHAENIKRLLEGTESKILQKK